MIGHTEVRKLTYKICLAAPEELKVTNVETGIKLAWKEVSGATGYVIYRRERSAMTNGKWTAMSKKKDTTSLKWTDTSVDPSTKYDYVVKAYFSDPTDSDLIGLGTPKTRMVRITTRAISTITAGAQKLTIKWGKDTTYTGYQVQVATDTAFKKNVRTVTITDTNTVKTTISNLKAKTTYYVRVRSYHEYDKKNYYGQWSPVKNNKTN